MAEKHTDRRIKDFYFSLTRKQNCEKWSETEKAEMLQYVLQSEFRKGAG